jgi:acyl carrier protein
MVFKRFLSRKQSPRPDTSGDKPASANTRKSEEAVEAWLISKVAELTLVAPSDIDVKEEFMNYGLGSRQALMLAGEFEEWLGCELSAALVYEHPTIEAVVRFIADESGPRRGLQTHS